MFEEKIFSLSPVNFFTLSCDCRYLNKKELFPSFSTYLLPNTNRLCHEYAFAKVAMGWQEGGLGFHIQVDQAPTRSVLPDVQKGDSVELMIDTRDLKSAGFNTRFCHHFYFLPEPVEGQQCAEITHFRTEDSHPLCDPYLLQCETKVGFDGYKIKIFIPTQCLYGYDPKQFDRVGFTYRINRAGGRPQHFSVVSQEYQVDQQPSLWSSIRLIK
jgi:hypothetical protein